MVGFKQLIISLKGFTIFWVFDGKPCSEKDNTIELRRQKAENAKKYCEELKKEIKEYEKNEEVGELLSKFVSENDELDLETAKERLEVYIISEKDKKKLQEFLEEKGCRIVITNNESDWEFKKLFNEKKIEGVISCDSDILAYGITNLITDFNPWNHTCIVYYLPKILEQLKLTEEEFRDICVCSGNDYCSNVYNVGVCKNYKLIKQYKNLKAFL